MRAARVGVVQKEYTCPHCNKEGIGSAMFKWHFNKCKNKKDE